MRILLMIDSLNSGGAESSTAVLADYLFQKKIEFQIVCLYETKGGFQKELQEKNYNIIFLKSSNFFQRVRELIGIVKKGEFTIVHSTLFRSNIIARSAKLFFDFNHIESLVSTTYSEERFRDAKVNTTALRIYKILDKYSAHYLVNHFHSISYTVKKHYITELGIDPEKITVIYRGRKPASFSLGKKSKETSLFNIINVGRHEYAKGQIFLLQAAVRLKELKYNFHIDIFGRRGKATPELEDFIYENELATHVTLKGAHNNIYDYLLKADLFVFPSLYEGLGGALIEAQAAGLPIACNDIPVLHEVVKEDVNAKFFDVRNPITFISALQFFLDDSTIRAKYGEASLKNFQQNFVDTRNHQKIIRLYRKVIANK